jgi:histidine ammonia-lyase
MSESPQMLDNCRPVLAIELLLAAQAISLRGRPRLEMGTEVAFEVERSVAPAVTDDRLLNPRVEAIDPLLASGRLGARGRPRRQRLLRHTPLRHKGIGGLD